MDLCNSQTVNWEDISEFLVNQKGFILLPRESTSFALSQAGERGAAAGLGLELETRLLVWTLPIIDAGQDGSRRLLVPEASVSSSAEWVVCVCWDHPPRWPSFSSPVLKFWNLIFLSPTSLYSLRPPPYLPPPPHPMISVSPVNQAKSAQGRDCGEKTSLRSWQMTISNAPYCKSSPSLGLREGQPRSVFLLWGLERRGICS